MNTPIIKWIGLGRDETIFKPIPQEQYIDLKKDILGDKEYDFVALVNNKNQHRKHIPDIIEAWRLFTESLSKEQSNKACLVLHTQISPHPAQANIGTDLNAVCRALAPDCNIVIDATPHTEVDLNKLYNLSDIFVTASSSEGWGLTSHEAILAGKPVIMNKTGGLKDQSGPNMQGEWCYMLDNNRTIIGSPATPYLYDEIVPIENIVSGFKYWYNISKEKRNERGLKGREWIISQELTAELFSQRVVDLVNETITNFKPRELFSIYE